VQWAAQSLILHYQPAVVIVADLSCDCVPTHTDTIATCLGADEAIKNSSEKGSQLCYQLCRPAMCCDPRLDAASGTVAKSAAFLITAEFANPNQHH
jgi:hypothetical protein